MSTGTYLNGELIKMGSSYRPLSNSLLAHIARPAVFRHVLSHGRPEEVGKNSVSGLSYSHMSSNDGVVR